MMFMRRVAGCSGQRFLRQYYLVQVKGYDLSLVVRHPFSNLMQDRLTIIPEQRNQSQIQLFYSLLGTPAYDHMVDSGFLHFLPIFFE